MWTSSLSMCSDSVSGMCLSWARGCKLIFCHSLILDCQSISGSGTIYNKIVSGRQSSCQPLPAGHSPEDKELESSMVGAQNPIRASSKTLKCWNNSAPAWIKNYPYECHRSVTDFQARSDMMFFQSDFSHGSTIQHHFVSSSEFPNELVVKLLNEGLKDSIFRRSW